MAYELMKVSERTWAALAMIEREQPKGETECAIWTSGMAAEGS
jgi:hypothetical protein